MGEQEGPSAAGHPRVALYSHDTMGIGHLRRNLLIAHTFARPPLSASLLLIAGAREAAAFPTPPGADWLTLPSLYKTADGRYRARALGVSLEELIGLRAKVIAAALRSFAPDVLVVDKEPCGAVGELEPALRILRAGRRTRCVLGLRDVLDDPATVRREWDGAANQDAIRRYYEAVWVYGDPAVYDPVREYHFGPEVAAKVSYTGYLDPRACPAPVPAGNADTLPDAAGLPDRFALCLVGGGQDGVRLAEAFAWAEPLSGTGAVIVTGPFMPAEARQRLHRSAVEHPRLRILEFVTDLGRLLGQADQVVAMGGYNTVCEVLSFGKPALIVPRVSPRREQLIRAERLRALGLLDVLQPDEATPQALSRWLARAP
ncbi:MAG TPA: glycosyltransferase, partial [Gemmataceae bacterium]|nr:glycosyltransferase [Gemmataceae bacterium]